MSATVAEAADPRGVVVALHGGATTSAYFNCPGHPDLSLLVAGVARGYTVVALDRPGYGASAAYPDAMMRPEQRVALAFGAAERIAGTRNVFVLGHSMGCELAVWMAVTGDVTGVSLAGTGLRYQSGARDILKNATVDHRPRGLRDLLWQPERLYPADVLGNGLSAGGTPYEGEVIKTWPTRDFPELAAQISAPVQFTAGDHESVWESDAAALSAIAALFTTSSRVDVGELADAGHNLSVGLTAPGYHDRVLTFVDECVATQARTNMEVEAG